MSYTVVVSENGQGRYQQEIVVAGRHRLLADEPQSVGGDDAGPAPLDFLMAGLGACTAMTLRMYAERKQWDLRHVEVSLRFDRIDAGDGRKTDRIERLVALEGKLDAEQRRRLLEIADKCPMHKVLQQPLRIDSRLAG